MNTGVHELLHHLDVLTGIRAREDGERRWPRILGGSRVAAADQRVHAEAGEPGGGFSAQAPIGTGYQRDACG